MTDVENNSVLEFFCIGVFPSNAAATVVLIPGGSTINCAAGAPPAEIRVPFTGTLKNLYVSAVAGTGNEVVTVWANSSPTSLVCTVNQAANTQCSDTNVAHNVTITAGQTISLRVNNLPAAGGTLASMRASVQLH